MENSSVIIALSNLSPFYFVSLCLYHVLATLYIAFSYLLVFITSFIFFLIFFNN